MTTIDRPNQLTPTLSLGMTLLLLFTLFLLVIGLHFALVFALTQPQVHVSASTKECVRVVSDSPALSCKNLPESYERVWVP